MRISALVFLSFLVTAELPASWVFHRVKSGENLTLIARKYRVQIRDIMGWNRLQKADRIYAGQRLKIRKAAKRAGPSFSRPGSWRIERRFDERGDVRNYGILARLRGNGDVYSAAPGRIIKIAYLRGYGRYILVDHGKGWITMYSHIQRVSVKTGQRVGRKALLGRAENRRLFFLVSHNGRPVNPIKVL